MISIRQARLGGFQRSLTVVRRSVGWPFYDVTRRTAVGRCMCYGALNTCGALPPELSWLSKKNLMPNTASFQTPCGLCQLALCCSLLEHVKQLSSSRLRTAPCVHCNKFSIISHYLHCASDVK